MTKYFIVEEDGVYAVKSAEFDGPGLFDTEEEAASAVEKAKAAHSTPSNTKKHLSERAKKAEEAMKKIKEENNKRVVRGVKK